MKESWLPVLGYEGLYEVSDSGRVRLARATAWHPVGWIVAVYPTTQGYFRLNLFKDKRRKVTTIHRLVASAFHPNPSCFPMVRHLDGDRSNNRAENLMWGNAAENAADMLRHGTHRNQHIPRAT